MNQFMIITQPNMPLCLFTSSIANIYARTIGMLRRNDILESFGILTFDNVTDATSKKNNNKQPI